MNNDTKVMQDWAGVEGVEIIDKRSTSQPRWEVWMGDRLVMLVFPRWVKIVNPQIWPFITLEQVNEMLADLEADLLVEIEGENITARRGMFSFSVPNPVTVFPRDTVPQGVWNIHTIQRWQGVIVAEDNRVRNTGDIIAASAIPREGMVAVMGSDGKWVRIQ